MRSPAPKTEGRFFRLPRCLSGIHEMILLEVIVRIAQIARIARIKFDGTDYLKNVVKS